MDQDNTRRRKFQHLSLENREEIVGVIKAEKNDWKTNHESIYQFIYSERMDLIPHLKQGWKKRLKHGQAKNKMEIKIVGRISIDSRPKDVEHRNTIGHWEIETVVSQKSKPCVLVGVERSTGFAILEWLPSKHALGVHNALIKRLGQFPSSLVRTLTYTIMEQKMSFI